MEKTVPQPDTINLADSVQLMASWQSESFDAIITDPPYGVTGDDDDYVATKWLYQAYRLLKPNSALIMCVGQATLREFWNEADRQGFKWLNTIVWWYKNTIKRERRRFAIQYDPILYFSKGDFVHRVDDVRVDYLHPERLKYPTNNSKKKNWMPNPLGAICGDVWEISAVNATSGTDQMLGHKWQKPIKLFDRMVRATCEPGMLMLDPFCGSGTSLEAARNYGVHYVGIDNDQASVDLASRRLAGLIPPKPKRAVKKPVKDIFE